MSNIDPSDTAIVRTGAVEIVEPDQATDDVLAMLEKRNRIMERILTYAISATHPSQWTYMGEKPWPGGPAAEAMARRCGVSWDEPTATRSPLPDDGGPPGYQWTYRARFFLPGGNDSVWAEGHCNSRDQFLGTGADGSVRELHEVDEGHIRQAAMTNMKVNGICSLLGVRSLSKERLDGIFGSHGGTAAIGKVEYKAGAKGGGRGQGSADVEIKFGKGKGKMLSELSDDDVKYYVGMWQRDLTDPEKAKFHKYSKANVEIAEKLLAERANAKAGVGQQQGGAAPNVFARIQALPEVPKAKLAPNELAEIIGRVTGKKKASELEEADVAKVKAELARLAADRDDSDINF